MVLAPLADFTAKATKYVAGLEMPQWMKWGWESEAAWIAAGSPQGPKPPALASAGSLTTPAPSLPPQPVPFDPANLYNEIPQPEPPVPPPPNPVMNLLPGIEARTDLGLSPEGTASVTRYVAPPPAPRPEAPGLFEQSVSGAAGLAGDVVGAVGNTPVAPALGNVPGLSLLNTAVEGVRGQPTTVGDVEDAYNTDIPVYSDFARSTIQPAAGFLGEQLARSLPASQALDLASSAIGTDVNPLPAAGRIVGEALAPVTAGDVALELMPGIGAVPDGLNALRRAGLVDAAGRFMQGATREKVDEVLRGLRNLAADETGSIRVPFGREPEDAGRVVDEAAGSAPPPAGAVSGAPVSGGATTSATGTPPAPAPSLSERLSGATVDTVSKNILGGNLSADAMIEQIRQLDGTQRMDLSGRILAEDRTLFNDLSAVVKALDAQDDAAARAAASRFFRGEAVIKNRATRMTEMLGDLRDAMSSETGAIRTPDVDIDDSLGLGRRMWDEALGVVGAPIALKSTLSPPFLRQGMTRLVTAPRAAWGEMIESFRHLPEEKTAQLIDSIRHDEWVRSTSGNANQAAIAEERYLKGLGVAPAGAPVAPNAGYTWLDVGGTLLDPTAVDDLGRLSLSDLQKVAREGGIAFAASESKESLIRRLTVELQPEQLQGLNDSWVAKHIRNLAPVKYSDRQMALQLNLNRTNWYRSVAANMWKAGVRDVEEYIALRKFIEHATQRGSWSQGNVPAFFSTRALSGRVQFIGDLLAEGVINGILGGQALKPGAPQEAIKVLLGMTAAASAMVGIPAALGIGAVEMKDGLPTLRIGRQHFDPYAGWNPIAKFMHRFVKDVGRQFGNVKSGEISWEDMPQSVFQVVTDRTIDFLRNGLSPTVSQAVAAWEGRNFDGKYILSDEAKSGRLFVDMYAPFLLDSLYETYREEGLKGVAISAVPNALSMSTNTYRSFESERDRLFPNRDFKAQPLTYAEEQQIKDSIGRPESEFGEARREGGQEERDEQARLAEASFLEGQFPTSGAESNLPELWSNLSKEAAGQRGQLEEQFRETFAGYTPSDGSQLIDGYFNAEVRNRINRVDFAASEEAQAAYLDSLQPEQRAYVEGFLEYSRTKMSPLRREYLELGDLKDDIGYYDMEDEAKRQIQREYPQIEAITAWYMSGTDDPEAIAKLQTQAAVEVFMYQNQKWGTNFPVKIENTGLVVNQDEGSMGAYQEGAPIVTGYLESSPEEKRELQKDDEVVAWLAAFGYNISIKNAQQERMFDQIVSKYGLGVEPSFSKDYKELTPSPGAGAPTIDELWYDGTEATESLQRGIRALSQTDQRRPKANQAVALMAAEEMARKMGLPKSLFSLAEFKQVSDKTEGAFGYYGTTNAPSFRNVVGTGANVQLGPMGEVSRRDAWSPIHEAIHSVEEFMTPAERDKAQALIAEYPPAPGLPSRHHEPGVGPSGITAYFDYVLEDYKPEVTETFEDGSVGETREVLGTRPIIPAPILRLIRDVLARIERQGQQPAYEQARYNALVRAGLIAAPEQQ